jgi:hypothetical protein
MAEMLLYQYEDVLEALALLSNIPIGALILMQQDRDQAPLQLVLMRRLLAEIVYHNVVSPKLRTIAIEPDHFRREAFMFLQFSEARLADWTVVRILHGHRN